MCQILKAIQQNAKEMFVNYYQRDSLNLLKVVLSHQKQPILTVFISMLFAISFMLLVAYSGARDSKIGYSIINNLYECRRVGVESQEPETHYIIDIKYQHRYR